MCVCAGETISEGGFAKNKVSSASLLDVEKATDSKGKTYYKYNVLVRAGEPHCIHKHSLPCSYRLADCAIGGHDVAGRRGRHNKSDVAGRLCRSEQLL